jgi:N-acetylglucosamine-6-phosphate deacetylase
VPRPTKRVKSFGAIDLHFHGAFGTDLMTAAKPELDALSDALWKRGVAGFCATTLSASRPNLLESVTRLGGWIRGGSAPGARPLGIHLEGPFLNRNAAGAHTPGILRDFKFEELESLWEASKGTIKILTLAPETLSPETRKQLGAWARKRKVRLSIGHTRCTLAQARDALRDGFTGVTHAWNALAWHHRDPGALGAAFGDPKARVEIIPDGVHVDPILVDWTLALHPNGTFFVSDAAPAAGTDGSSFHRFGDLECRFQDGGSRLANGALAGGGSVLSDMFCRWVAETAARRKIPAEKLLKTHLDRVHRIPLEAIFLPKSALKKFPVTYEIRGRGTGKAGISALPISAGR